MVKLDTLIIIIGVVFISTIIIFSVCYFVFEYYKYHFLIDEAKKISNISPNTNLKHVIINSTEQMYTYFRNELHQNNRLIYIIKSDIYKKQIDNEEMSYNFESFTNKQKMINSILQEESIFVKTSRTEDKIKFLDYITHNNCYVYKTYKYTYFIFLGKKLYIVDPRKDFNYDILTIRGVNMVKKINLKLMLYLFNINNSNDHRLAFEKTLSAQENIISIRNDLQFSNMNKIIDFKCNSDETCVAETKFYFNLTLSVYEIK